MSIKTAYKSKRSVVLHSASFIVVLILVLSLRHFFPLSPDAIFSGKEFHLNSFFEIISITALSVIPIVFGIVYALIFQVDGETPADKKPFFFFRLLAATFMSFVITLISAVIIDPVQTEGLIRTVFISMVLSVQTPLVTLVIIRHSGSWKRILIIVCLFLVFLATIPYGLLLHHPWNYIAFFSPLYWTSWAWIIPAPLESLVYGMISVAITSGCLALLLTGVPRHMRKE